MSKIEYVCGESMSYLSLQVHTTVPSDTKGSRKSSFFIKGKALTPPPPPLLIATKKRTIFAASLICAPILLMMVSLFFAVSQKQGIDKQVYILTSDRQTARQKDGLIE